MSTDIYKGYGWNKKQVGCFDNENIYKGYGWNKTTVGCYDNGCIYSRYGWNRVQVGAYSGSNGDVAATTLLLLLGI